MVDYTAARTNMVESQIRANNVTDPAITAAFMAVPRELFVPRSRRPVAYVDEDLAIKPGRWLLEPMVFARLLQLAQIGPEDLVLDLGCATGYSTAVLSHLAAAAVGLDDDPELLRQAGETLAALDIDNAVFVEGPLRDGWAKQAPYNVIVLQGAAERIPEALSAQLAEGGRLVAVMRGERGPGRGSVFVRERGRLSGRPAFDAATPWLPGFEPQPQFVF